MYLWSRFWLRPLHYCSFDRVDRREVIGHELPGVAGIARIEELTSVRADIDTSIFVGVCRHGLAQDIKASHLRQAPGLHLPRFAGIAAAPYGEPATNAHVIFLAFFGNHIDGARLG